MRNTFVILAFMAASTALFPAQAGTALMTNNTIEAMVAGGVPVTTIVYAIKHSYPHRSLRERQRDYQG